MDLLTVGNKTINLELVTVIEEDDEGSEGLVVHFGPGGRTILKGAEADLLRRFIREHSSIVRPTEPPVGFSSMKPRLSNVASQVE